VKTLAEATVTAVKSDDPEALLQLQELRGRPDLTPAQRTAANQSMYAVLARLNAAATNGDTKAVEALERYQSLK
jgi:hypothetical protein